MKIGRRGFLRAMGLAPLAGKHAAEQAAAHLANINVSGVGVSSGVGINPVVPLPSEEYTNNLARAFAYMKAFGMPTVLEDELRQYAGYVRAIDPDIAIKRSWSLSVKIATQRARNLECYKSHVDKSLMRSLARREFNMLSGSHWPF